MNNLLKKIHGVEATLSSLQRQLYELPQTKLDGVVMGEDTVKALESCHVMLSAVNTTMNNIRHTLFVESGLRYRMRQRYYVVCLRMEEEFSLEAIYGLNAVYDGPWSSKEAADAQAMRKQYRNDHLVERKQSGNLPGVYKGIIPQKWVVACYDPTKDSWSTYLAPKPTEEQKKKLEEEGVKRRLGE